ncbi:beta-1,4-glycosyltransferase [Baekduia alba]|uniref:tetratricopeptide repeat-containing glycosyltransferase family 2 protein n=1 Tax=Baekduia alba TaxID=2997333 RepID=UPI0023404EF0|nr:TPR domain-containing glycosyltransferase [Baekduia alba]WCB91362.1 beta-1,4-glycosyltransferase [Baekduia alba]
MALRLVAPVDGPAKKTIGPATGAAAVATVTNRASALLDAHDLAGWRKLVDAAAELTDHNDRYQARRLLVESTLVRRSGAPAQTAERFLAGAVAALDALDDEPREPVLLNFAGVLLYELGAVVAAESLFRAAQRLDEQLADVGNNLRECKRRRQQGITTPQGLPAQVLRALRDIGPRAQRVAQKAVPAEGQTVSLCMIVKDEEAMLPRSLAAVAAFVDELIVVDTGSSDRTVEIAESFGATVLHHEWDGDFSAARNVGLDAATSDWLMYLDADEVLVDGEGERLRELLGHTWREGIFLVETNHVGEIGDGAAVQHNALRVFRNRPEYRFTGRVHEQFAHKLPTQPERIEYSRVRIEHFGYLGAVRDAKEKSRRNLELLQRQLAEGVDTPFLHFNLGSERAAAGDVAGSLVHLGRAWALLLDDPQRLEMGFFPSLAARLVKALNANRRHADAIKMGEEVLALLPDFTDIVLEQAMAYRGLSERERAVEKLEQCVAMGDAPSKYSATVGAGTFHARNILAETLIDAGRLDEAAVHLEHVLEHHPDFVGCVEPYARVLLRRGTPAADVVARVAELVPAPTPAQRFLLAVPFYEAGAIAEAEIELHAVLDAQPGAHAARVALAEAELSKGDLAAAARIAAEVPIDAPHAPAAARTLLFAHLAAGADAAVLDEAFAYARDAGVNGPELAALAAWRGGPDAPASVPAQAQPLLTAMLEALARLEAFDAFERLAGVVERLDVAWREQRELLAGVYYRRGFLDSAAREWFGVVERLGAPDERALLGMALLADAQGLPDDAELLRAEAKTLAQAAA